jgi:hypothetical protein
MAFESAQQEMCKDPLFHQLCNFIEDELHMPLDQFQQMSVFERMNVINPSMTGRLPRALYHAQECVVDNPWAEMKSLSSRSASFILLTHWDDFLLLNLYFYLNPDYVWMLTEQQVSSAGGRRMVALQAALMQSQHEFFPLRDHYADVFRQLHMKKDQRVCLRHRLPLNVIDKTSSYVDAPAHRASTFRQFVQQPLFTFHKSRWSRSNSKVQLIFVQNQKKRAISLICELAWKGGNRDAANIVGEYMDDALGSAVGEQLFSSKTADDARFKYLKTLCSAESQRNKCGRCKESDGLHFNVRPFIMNDDIIMATNVEPASVQATAAVKATRTHVADGVKKAFARGLEQDEHAKPQAYMDGVLKTLHAHNQPYFYFPFRASDWKQRREPDPLNVDAREEVRQRHAQLVESYKTSEAVECSCPAGFSPMNEIEGVARALNLCVWALCLG